MLPLCTTTRIATSDIDTGNNLVLMTNLLYGVGTAAIAGGVTWWLLTGDQKASATGEALGLGVGPRGEPMVQFGGGF